MWCPAILAFGLPLTWWVPEHLPGLQGHGCVEGRGSSAVSVSAARPERAACPHLERVPAASLCVSACAHGAPMGASPPLSAPSHQKACLGTVCAGLTGCVWPAVSPATQKGAGLAQSEAPPLWPVILLCVLGKVTSHHCAAWAGCGTGQYSSAQVWAAEDAVSPSHLRPASSSRTVQL